MQVDRVFVVSRRVDKEDHGGLEALHLVQIHEPYHGRGVRSHGDPVVLLVRRDQPLEEINHVDDGNLIVLH